MMNLELGSITSKIALIPHHTPQQTTKFTFYPVILLAQGGYTPTLYTHNILIYNPLERYKTPPHPVDNSADCYRPL
jgi:hypothetical protein